ncbi:MAG: DUF1273 family protein [Clostridia bacterium]|nr:DUF1273 family protein [Clostridia bacterium]
MHVACFTGHREIPTDLLGHLAERLRRAVEYAYDHGVREFRAGGALGFDTLAALTVLDLKELHPDVRLCLYLPCQTQTRGWSERDCQIYQDILQRADSYTYTSEHYHRGCMMVRNRALVDGSDVCIAFCKKSTGGSAYTVKYASTKGLTVWNLASNE